jgi:hypothetical protein
MKGARAGSAARTKLLLPGLLLAVAANILILRFWSASTPKDRPGAQTSNASPSAQAKQEAAPPLADPSTKERQSIAQSGSICGRVEIVGGSDASTGRLLGAVRDPSGKVRSVSLEVQAGSWCLDSDAESLLLLISGIELDGRPAWPSVPCITIEPRRQNVVRALVERPVELRLFDKATGRELSEAIIADDRVSLVLEVRAEEVHPHSILTSGRALQSSNTPLRGSWFPAFPQLFLVSSPGYSWALVRSDRGVPRPTAIFLELAGSLRVERNGAATTVGRATRLELCPPGDTRNESEAPIYDLLLSGEGILTRFEGLRAGEYSVFVRESVNGIPSCPRHQGDIAIVAGSEARLDLRQGLAANRRGDGTIGGYLHGWESERTDGVPDLRLVRLRAECAGGDSSNDLKLTCKPLEGSAGELMEWQPASVPAGEYLLRLRSPPFSQKVAVRSGEFKLVDLRLPAPVELTIEVRDRFSGKPVAIDWYSLVSTAANSELTLRQFPVDNVGKPSVEGLIRSRIPAGAARLLVFSATHGSHHFRFDASESKSFVFELEPTSELHVRGRALGDKVDLPAEAWNDVAVEDAESGEILPIRSLRHIRPAVAAQGVFMRPGDMEALAMGKQRATGVILRVPTRQRYRLKIMGCELDTTPELASEEHPAAIDLTPRLLRHSSDS